MAKKLSKTQKRKKSIKKKNKNIKVVTSTKVNKTIESVKNVPNKEENKTINKVDSKKDLVVKDAPSSSVSKGKKKGNYYNSNYKRKVNINTKKKPLPKLKEEFPKVKEEFAEVVVQSSNDIVEPVVEVAKEKSVEVDNGKTLAISKKELKKHEEEKRKLVENNKVLYNIFVSQYDQKKNKKIEKVNIEDDLDEDDYIEEDIVREKSDKWYVNVFYFIVDNLYLLFNTVLGFVFVLLLFGLVKSGEYDKNTIIFVGCILMFLILVAMSYNKHLSGRIFTIILCLGMGFYINKLQNDYDFIHALDRFNYESKTYYIVTLDTANNRNVYGLNNKKVGILSDNRKNVVNKLNIKMDSINYIDYNDLDSLEYSLFKQEVRGVIVTPNQYKYLMNVKGKYNREIKVLYEFNAIGLK